MQEVDGRTLREHLESVKRQTGVVPAMLADAPSLPAGCEMLWRDFMALHATRQVGMSGPARITYGDMVAYQTLGRFAFAAWEIEAIRRADIAFLETRKANA